jgi:glycosyltransferase involved in cell wall biosynthesis
MAEAFTIFAATNEKTHLIIVGPDEESLRPKMRELFGACIDRVHFVDLVHIPEEYMACADVFCMPSYREGFGTALINAAAVGIPAIASRIYGSSDAIDDGHTGFLFEAGNIDEFVTLLRRLEGDPELRLSMGKNARARATDKFSEELLTQSLLEFYKAKLDALSRTKL